MSNIPLNSDPTAEIEKSYPGPKRQHSKARGFMITSFVGCAIAVIVGASLIGVYIHKAADHCEEARERLGKDSAYDVPDEDCLGPMGLYWAGWACFAIAIVLGIAFFISLVLYCVRRRHNNSPTAMYNSPPVIHHHYAQPYDPYSAPAAAHPLRYSFSPAQYNAQSPPVSGPVQPDSQFLPPRKEGVVPSRFY